MVESRALLVTDLVDSTAIASRVGDAAMAPFWTAHDRLARDLLAQWRGREIDRTDGFFMIFERAVDALRYAQAYHAALAAMVLPGIGSVTARVGLHVGEVWMRANPEEDIARGAKRLEADGLAKAVAARVMSVARGGQTLVSAAARGALAEPLPAAIELRSHGHWQLKGLPEPVELFEAGSADSPFAPPADSEKVHRVVRRGSHWLPAREVIHSLPPEQDEHLGRAAELRTLSGLFAGGARLVTVHGIGGNGKTRLVLHYGWRWLGEYAAGAWFCDLAGARDTDGIVRAVAEGLRIPLGRLDAVEQIGHAIAGRGRCLVILDNAEQVAGVLAPLVTAWLARAPEAAFAVTSREVLRVPAENVLELGPMALDDAVELFRRRAVATGAAPGAERADVERLVTLLDAMPLAIELAAGRSALLTPRELLLRVGERFKLLTGAAGRPRRHATLRAMLDWSWDLLSDAEREALAQLSTFEGGASIAAVEATVKGHTRGDTPDLIDVLQSLADRSWLRRDGQGRLCLLATVAAYAGERLATAGSFPGSGEAALRDARARHWRWFAALGPDAAVAQGCAELANLIAATRHAASAGDAPAACGALEGAWAALRLQGPFALGVELARAVEAIVGDDPSLQARVDRVAGGALRLSGRAKDALARFERGLQRAHAAGDAALAGQIEAQVGDLRVVTGRHEEGVQALERALAGARSARDTALEAQVLTSLGIARDSVGELDPAAALFEQALAVSRVRQDRRREAGVLGNLALVRHRQGLLDEAERLYREGLAAVQAVDDRQWEGNTLSNLGLLLLQRGDLARARTCLDAALGIARELGHRRLECMVSTNLGDAAAAAGDEAGAAALYDTGLRIARELDDARTGGQIAVQRAMLHVRQGQVEAARRYFDEGSALLESVGDRLSCALLLCARAEAECRFGHPAAARSNLAACESLAAALGGSDPELARRCAELRRQLDAS